MPPPSGKTMSGRAHNSVRTPERREVILQTIRTGGTRSAAAGRADMNVRTLERWLSADAAFRRDIGQAEATAESRFAAIVADDALGRPAQYDDRGNVIRREVHPNVASARWWLERRRPHEWGQRLAIDVRAVIDRVAAENGLDPDDLIREAETLMAEHAERYRK